jgi:phenylalanyl-tRNA synthetase beta chain
VLVSINWIKQYVDLPEDISAVELGEKFTLATCEVEKVEKTGDHLSKVIIVEILETEQHPDADKLRLVTFDIGGGKTHKVVCGAPNARPGIKVPFAPVGTELPGGFLLEPKKIRGILSEGMLCGETELEIGDDDSGIKEFPLDAPVGTSLAEYMGIESDIIFDIDNKSITHRPDLWGHYGMAREFAAVFKNPLKDQFSEDWKASIRSKINSGNSVIERSIEEDTACLAYCGAVVKNVKVGDSPQWIKDRLQSAGLRSINNIVDISNFVMLELGMPNHIFDLSEIKGGKIVIRKAGEDKEFVTLDEETRTLDPADTMVCDAERPLALAGIMGGLNSGVQDSTTDVFIETANWVAEKIRKTSTRIGLRTDSSLRFEKTLDSCQCETAMLRIIELLTEQCPEAVVEGDITLGGPETGEYTPVILETSASNISAVLGKEVSEALVVDILERLAFIVEKKGETLAVTVPTFRATKDVYCEADLMEEIGRIIGFDNITPEAPASAISTVKLSPAKQKERKIKDFLVYSANALEIMTYPMVGEKLLKKAQWPEMNEELVLVNSISRDADRMRPSLVPGVLQAISENTKHYSDFRLFEVGRSYQPGGEFAVEKDVLTVAFYSRKKSVFMDLQDAVEKLLTTMNFPFKFDQRDDDTVINKSWTGLHPFENTGISMMGQSCGRIFSLHPVMMSGFKMKGNLALAVIDLSRVMDKDFGNKVKYKPLPKFQDSTFDCTVVVDADKEAAAVIDAVKKSKIKQIASVKIADIYVPEGSDKRYVTVRTVFQDPEATLKGAFLEQSYDKVIKSLDKAGFALKVD